LRYLVGYGCHVWWHRPLEVWSKGGARAGDRAELHCHRAQRLFSWLLQLQGQPAAALFAKSCYAELHTEPDMIVLYLVL